MAPTASSAHGVLRCVHFAARLTLLQEYEVETDTQVRATRCSPWF